MFLCVVLCYACSEEEPIAIGTINLSVDKQAALASNDTITITAEVLDPTFGRIEGLAITYYANDEQLPSNLFIPTKAGIFILSARVGDFKSKIQKVKVVSLDDPVDELTLAYNGTGYLTTNPWSVSKKFDRQVRVGLTVFEITNNIIPLYVDGKQVLESVGLHFDTPGSYLVYTELNGQRSNEITLIVRDAKKLDIIEIPIVYHAYGFEPEVDKIRKLTEFINRIYNAESFAVEDVLNNSVSPNAANMYIRFKMVESPPEGFELSSPGIHIAELLTPDQSVPDLEELSKILNLHNWDPSIYLNLWIFDGFDIAPTSFNEVFVGKGRGIYTAPVLSGAELGGVRTFPSVRKSNGEFIGVIRGSVLEDHPDYVLTMIGYYLGLFDTYEFDCIVEGDFCADTNTLIFPFAGQQYPTGQARTCKEDFYFTNNFMSINMHYTNFTYDQRARMRKVLTFAPNRPKPL